MTNKELIKEAIAKIQKLYEIADSTVEGSMVPEQWEEGARVAYEECICILEELHEKIKD